MCVCGGGGGERRVKVLVLYGSKHNVLDSSHDEAQYCTVGSQYYSEVGQTTKWGGYKQRDPLHVHVHVQGFNTCSGGLEWNLLTLLV